jgi:catechol 2,3-dioxygenase-like lactoylglutathione lyase family enzyme
MPRALRTHHLGVTVGDLHSCVASCVAAGFSLDMSMNLDDETAAVGNGVDALSLQTAWLSLGGATLELIECLPAGPTRRAFPDDVGTGAITLRPGSGGTGHQEFSGVDGCPITFDTAAGPGVARVELRVASPEDTARLFARIGFHRSDSAPGTVTVRSTDLVVDIEPARVPNGSAAPNEPGRFQISQVVDDVDEMCRTLRDEGWTTVSAPQPHASGVRWCFVRDPGGASLELIEVVV